MEITLIFIAILLLLHVGAVVAVSKPSVAITMLCRDEAVNLVSNLPAWLTVIDYFVFIMDNRTRDDSVAVINNVLVPANKKFEVVSHHFVGFGQARTLGLKTVWDKFPQATHVMVADPDWVPDISTMNMNELMGEADVYKFTVFDTHRHFGLTQRKMDWLFTNRPGLAMKYHVHEVVAIGSYSVLRTNWVVREVAKKGSWHTTVGHAASDSSNRNLFDLELVYKDLEEYGHDPHTHFYLGMLHEGYLAQMLTTLGPDHPDILNHTERALKYLELRATSYYDDEFLEQRTHVMQGLARIYNSATVRK
jgi:hypothetical protein